MFKELKKSYFRGLDPAMKQVLVHKDMSTWKFIITLFLVIKKNTRENLNVHQSKSG